MCLCVCLVTQSPPTLCDPTDCSPPGSSVHPRQEYWSGQPFPSPGGLPHSGVEPRSPALQVYSLPSEPPGSPQVSSMTPNWKIWLGRDCFSGETLKIQKLYQTHRMCVFWPKWKNFAMDWIVIRPSPPSNTAPKLHMLKLTPTVMTFGDRVYKKVIQVKWSPKGGTPIH